MADNKQLEIGKLVFITVGNFKGIHGKIKSYRASDNSYELESIIGQEKVPNLRWNRNEIQPSFPE